MANRWRVAALFVGTFITTALLAPPVRVRRPGAVSLSPPFTGGRAENVFAGTRLPDRAGGQRADDSGTGGVRLGYGRAAVGRRDARFHGRHHGIERARSDRPGRRARGPRSRRQDGQANRLCRPPRARAIDQGARSRCPRRRASERLADARHGWRSQDGHQGARHEPLRPAGRRSSEQRQRLRLEPRQRDAHRRPGEHRAAPEEWRLPGGADAATRRVGRDAR